jgi:hypothetical protein
MRDLAMIDNSMVDVNCNKKCIYIQPTFIDLKFKIYSWIKKLKTLWFWFCNFWIINKVVVFIGGIANVFFMHTPEQDKIEQMRIKYYQYRDKI